MEKILLAEYARLCQVLGDLQYKKSQLQLQIDQVEKELYSLNHVSALIGDKNDS